MFDSTFGYGYGWWTEVIDVTGESSELEPDLRRHVRIFSAQGWGGQLIAIVPELEIVVAITAAIASDEYECCNPLRIVVDEVIPAVVASPQRSASLTSPVPCPVPPTVKPSRS